MTPPNNELFPTDLLTAQNLLYTPNNLKVHQFKKHHESKEYSACSFHLNEQRIEYRYGKITPTKLGQFVTIWKRSKAGPIEPLNIDDPFDLVVVGVKNSNRFGQFIFPKDVLYLNGFLAKDGDGGKRAMRIYPPWDCPTSNQAKQTREWQLPYFIDLSSPSSIDTHHLNRLFS